MLQRAKKCINCDKIQVLDNFRKGRNSCNECERKKEKQRREKLKMKNDDKGEFTFVIRKNVPLPPKAFNRRNAALYAQLAKMEIGDSVVLGTEPNFIQRVNSAATKYGRDHGMVFAFRTEADGNKSMWRIKKDPD